ncbi:MAG: carboxypeptidase-like regulatory domain-containing protein, partial [Muribaculaceae bacterium]|nr:carboxypeptidase-like regulatory domain-containing protein [Muribaculaceae bacterium]
MKPTPKVFTCSLASLAILLSMLGTSSTMVAQQKTEIEKKIQDIEQNTLTGEIFDEEGEPVIGAVVKIEGTPNAVTTNLDGKFAITMPDNKSHVLEVRYVGMKPKRVEIDNKTKYIRLVMKPDVTTMSEVVVTGYQNIKRENATGAYQTIKADDLDKRYTGDLTSNLEGRVPGVVYDPNKSEEDALMI